MNVLKVDLGQEEYGFGYRFKLTFAALIKDSSCRRIILDERFRFFAPKEIIDEMYKYFDLLVKIEIEQSSTINGYNRNAR
jgi:hypothetical protein